MDRDTKRRLEESARQIIRLIDSHLGQGKAPPIFGAVRKTVLDAYALGEKDGRRAAASPAPSQT